MRFSLWTILWALAVLASAVATFGNVGIVAALAVVYLWYIFSRLPELTLVELLVAIAILGTLLGLLLPPTCVGSRPSRHARCSFRLERIADALRDYRRSHGSFPAAAQPDPNSEQLQSWRLWISPYLVESSLFFDNYLMNEPWDGPMNTKLVASTWLAYLFECPSHYSDSRLTHYMAVVGESTAWPPGRGRSLKEFTDGTEQTIMVVETPHKKVPWPKPEDLSFEEAVELLSDPPKGEHFGHEVDEGFLYKPSRGVNVAFANGRVQFLRLPISREHAAALLTVDGGEELDPREVSRLTGPELDYERIYSLSVFLLLSLMPLFKLITRKREIAAI